MFESLLNTALLTNPLFIAAVFAIIRNVGGYIYNCFEAGAILPYDKYAFLTTLGLWETLFIILASGADLDIGTTAILTMILDFIRSLKTAITNATKTLKTT